MSQEQLAVYEPSTADIMAIKAQEAYLNNSDIFEELEFYVEYKETLHNVDASECTSPPAHSSSLSSL